MAHKFDAEKAGILDDPERLQFLNPEQIFQNVGLNDDTVFADLGCGTGFFAIPASSRVKKVYAIDVQQDMLDNLKEKIKETTITNIETRLSEESSLPLPDGSVDVLFLANVFHELENPSALLEEGKRVLSAGGRLIIIDWEKIDMDFGPPCEERYTPPEAIAVCRKSGFELREQSKAGPYNYLLLFEVASPPEKRKRMEDKVFHGERVQYEAINAHHEDHGRREKEADEAVRALTPHPFLDLMCC